MRRREQLMRFMRAHNTPIKDPAFMVISLKIKEDLPDFLADTEEHINCPGLKVVAVLSKKSSVIKCMSFQGYDPENGYIAVAKNLEFGHSPSLHLIYPRRVLSTATRKVTEWREHVRLERRNKCQAK